MHGTKLADAQAIDLTAYLASLAPPPPRRPELGATMTRSRAAARSSGRGNARTATSPPNTPRPASTTWAWSTRWATASSTPLPCGPSAVATPSSTTAASRSLREVFAREHHPRGLELSPREIDDLTAFLGTL